METSTIRRHVSFVFYVFESGVRKFKPVDRRCCFVPEGQAATLSLSELFAVVYTGSFARRPRAYFGGVTFTRQAYRRRLWR